MEDAFPSYSWFSTVFHIGMKDWSFVAVGMIPALIGGKENIREPESSVVMVFGEMNIKIKYFTGHRRIGPSS